MKEVYELLVKWKGGKAPKKKKKTDKAKKKDYSLVRVHCFRSIPEKKYFE